MSISPSVLALRKRSAGRCPAIQGRAEGDGRSFTGSEIALVSSRIKRLSRGGAARPRRRWCDRTQFRRARARRRGASKQQAHPSMIPACPAGPGISPDAPLPRTGRVGMPAQGVDRTLPQVRATEMSRAILVRQPTPGRRYASCRFKRLPWYAAGRLFYGVAQIGTSLGLGSDDPSGDPVARHAVGGDAGRGACAAVWLAGQGRSRAALGHRSCRRRTRGERRRSGADGGAGRGCAGIGGDRPRPPGSGRRAAAAGDREPGDRAP